MRAIRVLTACALAASAAVVAPFAAHADDPTFNAVTMVGAGSSGLAVDDAFLGTSVTSTSGANQITLTGSRALPSGDETVSVAIATSDSTPLAASATALPVGTAAGDVTVTVFPSEAASQCVAASGSVTVSEATLDTGSGTLSAFAADYAITCANGDTAAGVLRWNSAQPFDAVSNSVPNWSFATQDVGQNGQAKAIVFQNLGTKPETFGAASVGAATKTFSVTDGCTGQNVAPGGSCSVTVTPHPANTTPAVGELSVPITGQPAHLVQLSVQGTTQATTYLQPGPGRITITVGAQPGVFGAQVTQYFIYRGTSPHALVHSFNVAAGNFTDGHPTPGVTYYYAVRPVYGAVAGDIGTVMAAISWPVYSAGMYHRLGASSRLLNGLRVSAGHPATVQVTGGHGVPVSGVMAVAVNLTASGASAATSVWAYPAGTPRPVPADIALSTGVARSDFAIVRLDAHGRFTIATARGTTPITADVEGYYSANGLSTKYGAGGALQTYVDPGTILDTKAYGIGALPSNYYVSAPVNFSAAATPHVTSMVVKITAYGASAPGTITGFATDGVIPNTTVLSYGANTTTNNTAILPAGQFTDPDTYEQYPSVSFLNRGPRPVQLQVTILGFIDDNYYELGERYYPTSPTELMWKTLGNNSNFNFGLGRNGGPWTQGFLGKLLVSNPARSTALSMTGVGAGPAPAYGQLQTAAHQTAVDTTVSITGVNNQMVVHNVAGPASVQVWELARFEAYPLPTTTSYAATIAPAARADATAARPGQPAPHGLPGVAQLQRLS